MGLEYAVASSNPGYIGDVSNLAITWPPRRSLRQEHRAGEKLFIDFAGDTIPIHDPLTGEIRQGHLFVAVLGCSNYTYAEVTPAEQLADWIGAQVRALEFLGVPHPRGEKALVEGKWKA